MYNPAVRPPLRFANTIDGGSVAFTDTGAGPAVIDFFVASTVNLALDWGLPQIQEWLKAVHGRLRYLRFEARGLANSSAAPPARSMLEYVQNDIDAVANAAGLDSFAIRASAHCCAIAVEYAVHNPGRVSALVLNNPVVRDGDWTTDERRAEYRRVVSSQAAVEGVDVIAYEARRHAGDFTSESAVRLMEAILKSNSTPKGEACWEKAWELHHQLDLLPRVRALSVPTVITTETSFFDPFARELAEAIPGSLLVPGAGNTLPREQAAELARFISPEGRGATAAPVLASLSARERQVLALVAAGHSNAEIAAALVLSGATVTRHVANIFAKLGVHNRVQAAAFFHGIASEGSAGPPARVT